MLAGILTQFAPKIIATSLIMLLLAGTVYYLVQFGLAVFTELLLAGGNVFSSLGSLLKSNIWLLVVWMIILCTVKKAPLQKVVLKSMNSIIIDR